MDRIWRTLAFIAPRRFVYWCSIRLMGHATVGSFDSTEVPTLTCIEALERW